MPPIGRLWADVGVLAAGTAVAAGLSIWVVSRRKRLSFADLHPQLA